MRTEPASSARPRSATRAVPAGTYLRLAGIVIVWAVNWPLMKVALRDIGPLQFQSIRLIGAALVTAVVLVVLRVPLLPPREERLPMALIGLLQIGVLFGLTIIALQFVAPGRASVLTYTMQLWALPLGWLITRERLTLRRIAGGLLGMAGVVVFFNPALVDWHDGRVLLGNGMILGGAIIWALGSCLYRRRLWRSAFWTQVFWQLLVSALLEVVLTLAFERGHAIDWTPMLLAVMVFNWLLGTALIYAWWAKVLAAMPASQAGQIVSLVPIVALLTSAATLGEPVTPSVVLSVALIGAGIYTTMRG
jgi:drug/metabolite transporter (DMT)-like permease